jgi:hypothetical protein
VDRRHRPSLSQAILYQAVRFWTTPGFVGIRFDQNDLHLSILLCY